jgi:hypothetical protein
LPLVPLYTNAGIPSAAAGTYWNTQRGDKSIGDDVEAILGKCKE